MRRAHYAKHLGELLIFILNGHPLLRMKDAKLFLATYFLFLCVNSFEHLWSATNTGGTVLL